jgi:hypothetical protein
LGSRILDLSVFPGNVVRCKVPARCLLRGSCDLDSTGGT